MFQQQKKKVAKNKGEKKEVMWLSAPSGPLQVKEERQKEQEVTKVHVINIISVRVVSAN